MCKILFVGGGSIGHIAPAVAVWREFLSAHPKAQAHFVCSEREEDGEFLRKEHLACTTLHAPRLSWDFPWKFLRAYGRATQILEREKPAILFSKGGYVSVPVCLAAHRKRIPVILHESDVISGNANRLAARWAAAVCMGFPERKMGGKHIYTGNPVRADIASGNRTEGLRLTGFSGARPILLVVGGSQGAQALNQAVIQLLPEIQTLADVIHITGRGKACAAAQEGYWARPFVKEELKHLYAMADMALSRAGAGSISELAANGIPSIVVPLRGVGHDHQQRNAEYVAGKGGCILLQQSALQEGLLPIVEKLAKDSGQRQDLSEKIRQMHRPDAAGRICRVLEEALSKKQNGSTL
ncbi:MAG: UDP-N-acetylglucosamine--N-acetylmuramyl-(pentapeptide) pyrophosphoryl-undecaprenol N-acetylglucosamine transferase [Candidatus Peribacteraceae bacterium]|nr:UDP-N-acetylglucosamine--N-acetylmuramyl-(pentapeptide) pyrophosphoryl-undecaprenol N-acetylglucosamine transferase [Candidatus Peribacteraceae bacterium]